MLDSAPAKHFSRVAEILSGFDLAYLHLIEAPSPAVGVPETRSHLRRAFKGPLMVAGGYTQASAEAGLAEDRADLVAFGEAFIANPDLTQRMRLGAPLNPVDKSTFYSGGPRGYVDYPTLEEAEAVSPLRASTN